MEGCLTGLSHDFSGKMMQLVIKRLNTVIPSLLSRVRFDDTATTERQYGRFEEFFVVSESFNEIQLQTLEFLIRHFQVHL